MKTSHRYIWIGLMLIFSALAIRYVIRLDPEKILAGWPMQKKSDIPSKEAGKNPKLIQLKAGSTDQRTKNPREIYQEANYVVKISVLLDDYEKVGLGSGSVVKSQEYGFCVLTAAHLFPASEFSEKIVADFKHNLFGQTLKFSGFARNYDIAILTFENKNFTPQSCAVIGSSANLKPGDPITAIGSSSYGDFGIITGSMYNWPERLSPEYLRYNPYWPTILSVNMNIIRGFSGGPMINDKGELIGVAVGVARDPQIAVSFGLPIDDVLEDLESGLK